jgi:putative Ca2+/H+ antiporter (TMEM165/GDT1 family)
MLKWILAAIFFIFAAWILIPDKDEEFKQPGHFGAFFTTAIVFFLAEMGDKTQLATLALGARYANVYLVTLGTTVGMLAADGLAVFCGKELTRKISMQWIRRIASAIFVLFGLGVLLSNY